MTKTVAIGSGARLVERDGRIIGMLVRKPGLDGTPRFAAYDAEGKRLGRLTSAKRAFNLVVRSAR